MRQPKPTFLKFISVIQRNTQKYFDSILEDYHIGGGQQFFLVHIYENNGITMYDLAKLGQFDKATVTKAVRKAGYRDCKVFITPIMNREDSAVSEEQILTRNYFEDVSELEV